MTSSPGDPTVTLIKPPRRWPGFGFGELWRGRRVLLALAQQQFKARYSNMALGVAWVLLEPLLLTAIMAIMLGFILGRGDRYGLPYPVFLFTAWTAFRVFSRVVSQGGSSVRANGTLLERVYLPRALFPLSVALTSLVDLAFMVIALLALLFVYGITPGIGVLALPVLVAILYTFSLGLAFLFSATSMSLPDVEFVRGLMVRAWFWLSPIIYPSTLVPEELRNFYYLNPLVVVVEGFRWAFAQSPMPPPEAWLIGASSASVILVGGYIYFRRREPFFADQL